MQRIFKFYKILTGFHRTKTIFIRCLSTRGNVEYPFRFSVLGSGGRGTSKSLLLEFDRNSPDSHRPRERFLINCGETSNRNWVMISNHGFVRNDDKVHLLVTHNTNDKTGGISGLLGTLTNLKLNYQAAIYSPPGLVNIFKDRREVIRDMSRGFLKFSHSVNISCPMFTVHKIVLKKDPANLKSSFTDSYSYVFEVPRKDYNNPKLAAWKDVILVIDCPDENYISSVVNNPQFLKYQRDDGYRTCMVFHMSSAKILSSKPYHKFMKKFGSNTKHMLFHEECALNVNTFASSVNFVLNQLNEDIFPAIKSATIEEPNWAQTVFNAVNYLECLYTGGELKFGMNAKVCSYERHGNTVLNAVPDLDSKIKHIKAASKKMDIDPEEYPQIIFLGTGGSSGIWYRNQSCILVKINADTSFVMDCGEGSYDQMVHLFGDCLEEELAKIKMIFISHPHLDHCMGLPALLMKCREARECRGISEELYLLAISMIPHLYLSSIPGLYNLSKCYKFVNAFHYLDFKPIKKALGLSQLHVADVIHCAKSVGLIVKHVSGWSIAYTGDAYDLTRSFLQGAWGCDVLIHESSYEDTLIRKRNVNKHSCQCNAISNGERLKAKFTLLTHICMHQSFGVTPRRSKSFSNRNFIVQDFMKINFTQLPVLHMYTDLIYEIFRNNEIDKENEIERFKKLKEGKGLDF